MGRVSQRMLSVDINAQVSFQISLNTFEQHRLTQLKTVNGCLSRYVCVYFTYHFLWHSCLHVTLKTFVFNVCCHCCSQKNNHFIKNYLPLNSIFTFAFSRHFHVHMCSCTEVCFCCCFYLLDRNQTRMSCTCVNFLCFFAHFTSFKFCICWLFKHKQDTFSQDACIFNIIAYFWYRLINSEHKMH